MAMACSAAFLLSSNPSLLLAKSSSLTAALAPVSVPSAQNLTVPKSFNGLRRSFQPRSSRLVGGPKSSRRSFIVNAVSEVRFYRFSRFSIRSCLGLFDLKREQFVLFLKFLKLLVAERAAVGWESSARFRGRSSF